MKKINLIQTGGTIAMNTGETSGLNLPKWTEALYKEIPELSQIADLHVDKIFYEDSSDINHIHWIQLIEHIEDYYGQYDGFVILHGTDTMAYTASALSFAIQNLGKPVIITGSQVPLHNLRSDAKRNLVNAVELATYPVSEVAICFNDHLFRGNRSTKMSIGDFDAFASPNFPSLAEIGLEIELNDYSSSGSDGLYISKNFSDHLYVVKLHPNLDPKLLSPLTNSDLNVIILEAFGSGNFPIRGKYNLLPFIRKCKDASMNIVITSQAPYDAVDLTLYESGQIALSMGAVSAGDMTVEASVTKSMYLLGKEVAGNDFKTQFEENIAGERTN
jgi:L-asparaginase